MIVLNGERSDVHAGESIGAVLARLGLDAEARGVAVAVNGEVVPRAHWDTYAVGDDAHVEVLTAMQGG